MSKTFKTEIDAAINPAMQFISQSSDSQEEKTKKTPDGHKLNPLYLETKNKRLQLLVQPSLLKTLKKTAKKKGTSVNDLIHTILQDALSEK